MLPTMSRFVVLALLIGVTGLAGCGNGSKPAAEQQKTPAGEEQKIAVPGASATKGAADEGAQPLGTADDPRFHLKPEEGSIAIEKGEAKAGAPATAGLKLTPSTGWKVATDYPIKLRLEAPAGVKLDKTELTAGGRNKLQGDAAKLSEQELAFAIKATAEKAGSYEIKGIFKFGICEKESCHPKTQPVTITVAAN